MGKVLKDICEDFASALSVFVAVSDCQHGQNVFDGELHQLQRLVLGEGGQAAGGHVANGRQRVAHVVL